MTKLSERTKFYFKFMLIKIQVTIGQDKRSQEQEKNASILNYITGGPLPNSTFDLVLDSMSSYVLLYSIA